MKRRRGRLVWECFVSCIQLNVLLAGQCMISCPFNIFVSSNEMQTTACRGCGTPVWSLLFPFSILLLLLLLMLLLLVLACLLAAGGGGA